MPKLLFLLLLPLLASAQTTQRKGNLVLIDSPAGQAELQWISSSTFRYQRCPTGKVCPSRADKEVNVGYKVTESRDTISIESEYIVATVDRKTLLVSTQSLRGKALLNETVAPPGTLFSRSLTASEELWGLGPRTTPTLDLRGSIEKTTRPLLLSSEGFGLYFPIPGEYQFDLGRSNPARITVRSPFIDRLEFYFYYGPDPKEILPEHRAVAGNISGASPVHVSLLPSASIPKFAHPAPALPLPELIAYLNHSAMSAVAAPAIDSANVPSAIAAVLPIVHGTHPVPDRKRWEPYLYTYLLEARDRGIPMLHPLAMQYPKDPVARRENRCFMVGDEMIAVPLGRCYLPMGIWTDLRTEQVYKGRQNLEIDATGGLPLLAHNGTIVPIASDSRLELHYFPRLGAEFFIAEADDDLPTQVHAAPALDILRLEIESKVAREYEWVVHGVSKPVSIEPQQPVEYDETKRVLRTGVKAAPGSDIILNITLHEPL
ncbi:MAG: glycoside hydrolase family 31 protein [Bryobacteraceae bacterium]